MSNTEKSTVTIPTELYVALLKVLDTVPECLRDWVQTTGFGSVHRRDMSALKDIEHAIALYRQYCGIELEAKR